MGVTKILFEKTVLDLVHSYCTLKIISNILRRWEAGRNQDSDWVRNWQPLIQNLPSTALGHTTLTVGFALGFLSDSVPLEQAQPLNTHGKGAESKKQTNKTAAQIFATAALRIWASVAKDVIILPPPGISSHSSNQLHCINSFPWQQVTTFPFFLSSITYTW